MNSVPNSDSEQCIESRLGWVHRMHTLNPSCVPTARALRLGCGLGAVSWRTLGCVVAPSRSCRRCPLPCRNLLSVTIQVCIATQLLAARRVARRIVRLPDYVAAPAWLCLGLSRDTTQQASLYLSRYNRLYRDTLPNGQASLALCHDTIHCIVTQMGILPIQLPSEHNFFFFSHHFFSHSSYWKPPNIYIYIYIFIFQWNQKYLF